MSSKHGISVKLPLTYNSFDGPYTLNKKTKEAVRQNFKNLVLTAPGERVMSPEFGVGIRNFLFANFGSQTQNLIETKINEQVNLFMPVVQVKQVLFDNSAMDRNMLGVAIQYTIPDIGITEMLEFTI